MAYRTEIEKLEQRHAENPKQWFAALADAYRKQGDVDLAIEYVKSGLDLRPDYASAHIVLGRCYLDKDMDDAAGQAFQQVLELDAENIIALKSLEEIAERKGDFVGARRWLNRLLEVDPMNEDAHESLARLQTEQTEPEPAPVAEEVPVAESDEAPDAAEAMELSVSEDAVDADSVEVEPLQLDAALPMESAETEAAEQPIEVFEPIEPIEPIELESQTAEDEPFEAIEPIELEPAVADANSLLEGLTREEDSPWGDVEEETTTAIEPIELEPAESDASSLLAGMPEDVEPVDEEAIPAYIEPFELETPDADVNSWLSEPREDVPEEEALPEVADFAYEEADVSEEEGVAIEAEPVAEELAAVEVEAFPEGVELPMEAEYVLEDAETPLEVEELSEEEDAPLRASVPPTKEVSAVDLEALRAADEVIARPDADLPMVDEEGEEASGTTEIDAAELERLREEDAFAADVSDGVEEEVVDEVANEAEVDVQEVVAEEVPEDVAEEVEEEDRSVDEIVAEDVVVGTFNEDVGWDVADETEAVAAAAQQDEPGGPAEDSDALPLIMPDMVGGDETSTHGEPEPVVTETMAEVYAKQGLFEQAREIYEVLVMQHADDARLKARLEELTNRVEGAIQETRKSRFSVAATGGESAVSYLQRLFAFEDVAGEVATAIPEPVAEPEVDEAPTPLEEAFAEEPFEAPGEPTKAAPDEVSLASVFDGGVPEPSSVGDAATGLDGVPEESLGEGGVSFDEFYGSEPRPTLPETDGLGEDDEPHDEDDDFKNWLKGLKT